MNRTLSRLIAGLFILFFATVSFGGTVTFPQGAVTLGDLLGGGTITVGDKIFSDFDYFETGDMPSAENINVIPLIGDGDYGLRFQGGFVDLVGGDASDALISFSVTAPDARIVGATLTGNPTAPSGVASISETFLPDEPTALLSVAAGSELTDSVVFDDRLRVLKVQKDILLQAQGEAATVSFVDQTFQQIPEPGTAALAIFGFLGLMGWRRRSR